MFHEDVTLAKFHSAEYILVQIVVFCDERICALA